MKKNKRPSLDAEVVRIILLVLAIAGVLQLGLFGLSINVEFTRLEYSNTVADLGRVIAAIEAEKVSVTELARDYAGWDDARAYVEGTNPGFADENFNAEWVEVAKLDQVIIASPDAVVLWCGIHTDGEFSVIGIDAPDTVSLKPGSVISELVSAPRDKPSVSFDTTSNGIELICSYPITSSDYSAPPFGWVIFARRFDEQMIARMSDRSGLSIVLLENIPSNPDARTLKSGNTVARYYDNGPDRFLLIPVSDMAGTHIASIRTMKHRLLDAPAMSLLIELALSLAVAATLTALVLLPLMRRLAVTPLVRIAGHLNLNAEKSASVGKLAMGEASGRRDEIGMLADRIDALLSGLESKRTELVRVNGELVRLARIDHLTGLANRRSFDDYAKREVKRLVRDLRGTNNKGSISILIADIDHFKLYNDRYGHLAGDNCLRMVADVIAKNMRRPADFPCRFGGEEFILLLPETAIEGAMVVARNIIDATAALGIPHEDSPVLPFITLSIGVAASHVIENFDLGALIESADAAMYRAKKAGRNRVMEAV